MRRLLPLFLVLVGFGAQAYQLRRDSQGDVVRWREEAAFVVDVRLPQQLREPRALAAIEAAIQAFDASTPAVRVSASSAAAQPLGYDVGEKSNQSVIIALEDWPFAKRNLAATVVTVNVTTNEILDADIAFNLEEWRFAVIEDGSPADVNDVQNTLMHELGHALGLQHEMSDPDVVMYPAAPTGEVKKRVLAKDDEAGLLELYGAAEAQVPGEPAVGCSAAPGSSGAAAVAAMLAVMAWCSRRRRVVLARRRGRVVGAVAAVLPALGLAAAPGGQPDVAEAPEQVAHGEVRMMHSRWLEGEARLIVTDVEIAVRTCVKAPCAASVTLRVLGGRVGDIEQSVTHQPKLEVGEAVVLTWRKGRVSVTPAPGLSLKQPPSAALRVR
ncbi:MAG: matrixin family metalloprotease [Myxococcota bacterium]